MNDTDRNNRIGEKAAQLIKANYRLESARNRHNRWEIAAREKEVAKLKAELDRLIKA